MSFKSARCWLLPTKSKSNIGTIMKCIKEMPYNDDTTLNKLTINKNWKVAETNGNKYWQPQHLYITINERPKVGDWYIVLLNGDIPALEQVKNINDNVWVNKELFETTRHIDNCFKIIACTDTSLTTEFRSIDLVQAIDAEFLEWFVKNPSFERVEVNIEGYPCMSDGSEITFAQPANLGGSEDIRNNIVSYNKQEHTDTKNFVKAYDKKRYKIIIPKEEPKQTVQEYEQQGLEKYSHELKSKQDYKKMSKKFTEILTIIPDDVLIKYTQQETIEEAAENYGNSIGNKNGTAQFDFIQGAQWQAKRMYSDLSELRNDLYNKLPISDVDAFEILKVIKNHLQKLDVLCGNK